MYQEISVRQLLVHVSINALHLNIEHIISKLAVNMKIDGILDSEKG